MEGKVKRWPGNIEKPPKVGEVQSGTRFLFRPFFFFSQQSPNRKDIEKNKMLFLKIPEIVLLNGNCIACFRL